MRMGVTDSGDMGPGPGAASKVFAGLEGQPQPPRAETRTRWDRPGGAPEPAAPGGHKNAKPVGLASRGFQRC